MIVKTDKVIFTKECTSDIKKIEKRQLEDNFGKILQ